MGRRLERRLEDMEKTTMNTNTHTTPTSPAEPTWLTLREVADRLRLSERTIHRMIRDRRLKADKLGRAWRIRAEDADAVVGR